MESERGGIKQRDPIHLTEAADGGFTLTPHSPDFEREMKIAERIMDVDRETLRLLAK
jgi:hypothetical protein